jgi:hypothetical protein
MYYGRIIDIIEVDYYSRFSVVLFKCEWVNVTRGKGVQTDKFIKVTRLRMTHLYLLIKLIKFST